MDNFELPPLESPLRFDPIPDTDLDLEEEYLDVYDPLELEDLGYYDGLNPLEVE